MKGKLGSGGWANTHKTLAEIRLPFIVLSMAQHVQPSKIPAERDFTAGMTRSMSCSFVGTTGERTLDDKIMALANEIEDDGNPCLLAEMITTAVRIARGRVSESNFKLMNRALKEMRVSEEVFHPYRNCRKVAIYGSARTKPEEPEYQTAVQFARRMREEGFMSVTGAGPGIMAAGNEGAGRDDSFGLNITLPFEACANEFIAGDPKLIDFNYFFTRKLAFVKEVDAAVGCPGGFGTMDEIFEALTLIQTGKATVYPIVLLDAPGGTYWKFWNQFIQEHLQRLKLISDHDFALFKVTDDVEVAVAEITGFYRVFHSYRYVGDKLVIRLRQDLSEEHLSRLQLEFADIVKSGSMELCGSLPDEEDEPELLGLPRLVFRHRRGSFGRLRLLINAINEA
ncbi:LOG family protein [Roseibacillus persicicus]|uniref:LOG family protein n=1 Tax=Roseibacillus persicicus TaxID=454148 RepID=UPI00280FDFDF|nr:LOG family protein [Roseibacillus persicicus]MDQ8188822.1 LOG family protein [Roseibacillus persicicus]